MGAFNEAVYEVVRQIPAGRVASYGQVARMVGRPRNARFVGYALHVNPEPGVYTRYLKEATITLDEICIKKITFQADFSFPLLTRLGEGSDLPELSLLDEPSVPV